jgi:hypothetical protein
MAADINQDTLNKETDALFWAQTGYKPGQKLDPNNPTDKAYESVWMDTFRKVKRAADAGTLVTTFDHPVVAQHLSDATVANAAAAAHLDAAVAARDPAVSQENISAATTAAQISAQRAREAAANQPPTVSSTLVKEAGKEAIKTPPPPSAPSGEHIAHGQAYVHAHGPHTPRQGLAQPPAPPLSQETLYKETNARFWRQTGYKPGQRLDPANLQDREKAKIWRAVLQQVQREAAAGTLVFTSPELTASPMSMPSPMPPWAASLMPMPPWAVRPPMGPPYPQMPPYQAYPHPQRPPYQASQQPPSREMHSHERGSSPRHGHRHGQPPSRGPLGPQPGGQTPQMDGSSPQGGPNALPSGAPSPSETLPDTVPGAPTAPDTSPPPFEEPSSIGKYLAIGLVIVAGGGLLYYATSRKSTGRTPKVRVTSMSMLPRP